VAVADRRGGAAARPERSRDEWLHLLAGTTEGHLHGEKPEVAYDSAHELVARYGAVGLWGDGDVILDIGSGNGRLAIPLTSRDVQYLGVEPIAACVEFSRRLFAPWPHIRFVHADLRNEAYNPGGSIDPREFVFPAATASVDSIFLSSVFSHLGTLDVCRRYVEECLRVLRPGGRVGCSWFRSPPHALSSDTARSVFREADIVNLLRPFEVLFTEGGHTDAYHDQWAMILRKP
jgi:SAM-dependent methyltransferase